MNGTINEIDNRARLTRTLDKVNCGLVLAIALTLLLPLLRVLSF